MFVFYTYKTELLFGDLQAIEKQRKILYRVPVYGAKGVHIWGGKGACLWGDEN